MSVGAGVFRYRVGRDLGDVRGCQSRSCMHLWQPMERSHGRAFQVLGISEKPQADAYVHDDAITSLLQEISSLLTCLWYGQRPALAGPQSKRDRPSCCYIGNIAENSVRKSHQTPVRSLAGTMCFPVARRDPVSILHSVQLSAGEYLGEVLKRFVSLGLAA